MSDHSLPEDLSAWPRDPWELLGVHPGVGPRELRRIYTRLIRTYKPEQYPDHFRRIRDAYEAILKQVEFFHELRKSATDDENNSAEENETSAAGAAVVVPWRAVPLDTEELDQLWRRACAGDESAVYRRLVELQAQQPGRTDLLLRLYWLLALTPEVDPARSPCDWLVEGLAANGLAGPLWELYRREMADEPVEGVSERATRLVRLPAGAGSLADLAEWRWQAAGQLGRWRVIDDDLEILHDRLAMDEPEMWMRLLIAAAEQLAVLPDAGPQELAKECMKQIERFPHLQMRFADSLDRLELHLEVAAALRKLEESLRSDAPPAFVPWALLRLVGQSLTRPAIEVRPAVLSYLERMVEDPWTAMVELDQVQRLAAPVITQFSNVLVLYRGALPHIPEDGRSREVVARMVREFVDEAESSEYRDLRTHLLLFCLRESLTLEQVAEGTDDGSLASQINTDRPLQCVCLGCRLFWM